MHPSSELNGLRRKRDQEWEMAGLARQDGDEKAVKIHADNALRLQKEIGELVCMTSASPSVGSNT